MRQGETTMTANALRRTGADEPPLAAGPGLIGASTLVRMAYEQAGTGAVFARLMARIAADPDDADALMDMAVVLQVSGQREVGLELQHRALQLRRCYHRRFGKGGELRVVAFMTAGDLMANTPLEFLLEGSDMDLWMVYVDAETRALGDVPAHDVAFLAIGESAANGPVLANLRRLLAGWRGAILNDAPEKIAALDRCGVANAFAAAPMILSPPVARVARDTVALLGQGVIGLSLLLPEAGFPIIIRPVGTHAGQGLERMTCAADIKDYLGRNDAAQFYLSPFVDYAGSDGLFRKQRIAFINGRAFASHLAVSSSWMVHYLSAGMAEDATRRAEEARWMESFETDFVPRHEQAFDELCRRIGLDYFVIDCAEMPDGRLLLFEADVAMIVHDMDAEATFPYKKPAMRRLFAGFRAALHERAARRNTPAQLHCAHTGKAAVHQRSHDDCLIAALAMLAGRSHDEVVAAARSLDPGFPPQGPMSHSMMRAVAHRWGLALLSGIYMNWDRPAIIGVVSPTTADTGHAVIWDGEKIVDPGPSTRVTRAYVDRYGLEFTQRAGDLKPLIALERQMAASAGTVILGEP
jgi:hypothetical protein